MNGEGERNQRRGKGMNGEGGKEIKGVEEKEQKEKGKE